MVPRDARTTKFLWVPPRFVTPILIALLLQLWGAVTVTSVNPNDPDAVSKANKGKKIAQIGVAVQLACFGLFSIIAVRFNFTSKRFAADFEGRVSSLNEKYCIIDGGDRKLKRQWQAILRVTNLASVCILVRNLSCYLLTYPINIFTDPLSLSYGGLLIG